MIHIVSHVLKTKRLIIVIIIAIKNRCKEVFIKSSFTIPYQIKYFVSFVNAVFKANPSFFSQNLFKMPLYRKFPFILVTCESPANGYHPLGVEIQSAGSSGGAKCFS